MKKNNEFRKVTHDAAVIGYGVRDYLENLYDEQVRVKVHDFKWWSRRRTPEPVFLVSVTDPTGHQWCEWYIITRREVVERRIDQALPEDVDLWDEDCPEI